MVVLAIAVAGRDYPAVEPLKPLQAAAQDIVLISRSTAIAVVPISADCTAG